MTILESDIKLMASERLTDYDDGGGQMSAVEIQDGVVNNLFPDISRLDRTYGRVALRKAYPAVRTDNTDTYYGAHAIVTDAPDDPRVSVVLFTTDDYQDERSAARDRIESYVISAPESRMALYGDQLEGQRMVLVYQREDEDLPEVGEVYVLSHEDGNGGVIDSQFVRVTDLEHGVRTFTDQKGDFDRRVVTLEIGSPLRTTFPANDTPSRYSDHGNDTLLRSTQVADIANYFGIVKLAEDITQGDMTIQADTIYGQLVPSTQVESPVTDVQAGSDRLSLPAAASAKVRHNLSSRSAPFAVHFGRPIKPGNYLLRTSRLWDHGVTAVDDQNGNIVVDSLRGPVPLSVDQVIGSIDYESGVIDISTLGGYNPSSGYTSYHEAIPAGAIAEAANTGSIEVTLANRGYNYTYSIIPTPEPGAITVDYMVMGKWYRMRDNGQGELSDDSGGTGTVNYQTGSVVATLGALPDTGSRVLFAWGAPRRFEDRTGEVDFPDPEAVITTAYPISPGTLALNWTAGGQSKTAIDDGGGNLTGDAAGRVFYAGNEIRVVPSVVPDVGAVIDVDYQYASQQGMTISNPGQVGSTSFNVGGAIRPGTLEVVLTKKRTSYRVGGRYGGLNYQLTSTKTYTIRYRDAGDGSFANNSGSIDYANGDVVLNEIYTDSTSTIPSGGKTGSTTEPASDLAVNWEADSATLTNQSESASFGDFEINLTPDTALTIVPGSTLFTWNGSEYFDKTGLIYTDLDDTTGAAAKVGTINYDTGQVLLDTYSGGGTSSGVVKALLCAYGDWEVDHLFFRTPGAPLRPGSFYIRVNRPDGSLVTATSDLNGVLASGTLNGSVNFETGVVDIRFGQTVADSSLTADEKNEPWYDATNVDENGDIWQPDFVVGSTAKFNAVVYSIMPLDADVVGLDPVRLPLDGRVPIIRNGNVVVIHSTQSETLPDNLAADQVVSLSRDKLESVKLHDQNGAEVDDTLYTADRAAGSITMTNPLDLSAYVEPLIATHRVEDMALVNESQINGTLALTSAVSRDYSASDTHISSALIFGDLASRVHHLFSQQTWTGTWADERSGNNTSAQYNDVLYPIQINNLNSAKERWALVFTNSTSFDCYGEQAGLIASGTTGSDFSPLNPITGEPYFTVYAAGWGGGWATNNVLRFNTDAANHPVWIARTTISGAPTEADDSFRIQIRGDAD